MSNDIRAAAGERPVLALTPVDPKVAAERPLIILTTGDDLACVDDACLDVPLGADPGLVERER